MPRVDKQRLEGGGAEGVEDVKRPVLQEEQVKIGEGKKDL